jgi:hypothetical protein
MPGINMIIHVQAQRFGVPEMEFLTPDADMLRFAQMNLPSPLGP